MGEVSLSRRGQFTREKRWKTVVSRHQKGTGASSLIRITDGGFSAKRIVTSKDATPGCGQFGPHVESIHVPSEMVNAALACDEKASLQWGWVEASVWTERMLAGLGDGVKGGKLFSLMDKVYVRRTLEAAWKRVATNRGAAGVDGVSVERFQSSRGSLPGGNWKWRLGKAATDPNRSGSTRSLGDGAIDT